MVQFSQGLTNSVSNIWGGGGGRHGGGLHPPPPPKPSLHEPCEFSASMIATGRKPTLPPDVRLDTHPSPSVDDPSDYVEAIKQRLQLTHQQVTSPPSPPVANPYRVGSLIYALTTPPERTSKLSPQWKGPIESVVSPTTIRWSTRMGSWSELSISTMRNRRSLLPPTFRNQCRLPKHPTLLLGIYRQASLSLALLLQQPPLLKTQHPLLLPRQPISSQHLLLLLKTPCQEPATAPANQRPEPASRPRRSPRLNPEPGHARAIKSLPGNPPHHSSETTRMACTYPLTVSYNECLGSRATSLSFANLRIVDLRNSQSQYLSTIKQLMDALPKTVDPSSCFALQGHIARPGQKRLRCSMRAAIWFLLPSDGTFRRSSTSLQYFLTRQGRRVVLRGGDVAYPPWNSHINWIPDPAPPP